MGTSATAQTSAMQRIRHLILTDRFKAGTTLPSERELERKFNVSRATLRPAIASLVSQGLLRAKHGSGTLVRNWLSDGAFDLLTPLLLARQDEGLVEQLLWLRRLLHTSIAEQWSTPRPDFGEGIMASLEVFGSAWRYNGEYVTKILDAEERFLCLIATEVNLPAGMLGHAIRRALSALFAQADQPVVLSNEHAKFSRAMDGFMAGRKAVKLVDELCSLREPVYLEAVSKRP
jgi:DNA-binding transcriptional regulator YhcF (GntR family)